MARTDRSGGKGDLPSRDDVFAAVRRPTSRRQPASRVAVVLDIEDGHGLASDKRLCGPRHAIFEGLPKRPELLIFAVRVGEDLVEEHSPQLVVAVLVATAGPHGPLR